MNIQDWPIGHTKDWRFGLVTREVERLEEDLFEIHDMSDGWISAKVNLETFQALTEGKKSLLDLDWE